MINAVELEREISNAYAQWNPAYHSITGRYADGAVREVSYRRVSPVGNFIVSCECYIDREKNVNWTRNLRMYFTQADWKSMAEWISMVSEHLNVKEITIREYQYDAFAVLDAPYLSIYRSLEFFSL